MSIALSVIGFLWKAGWIAKVGAVVLAWLIPSPLQKAASKQADVKAAEDKADLPGHKVDDLDKLP